MTQGEAFKKSKGLSCACVCRNWSPLKESIPIQTKNKTSDAVVRFLTEALTGTPRAREGQSVRDSPHPNRMCLKKDEDSYKPEPRFL